MSGARPAGPEAACGRLQSLDTAAAGGQARASGLVSGTGHVSMQALVGLRGACQVERCTAHVQWDHDHDRLE